MTTQQPLGQFFHDLRVGRGVTLKAAAGDWSPTTLSRFEHGQQDLSTDKAVTLMARLGVESTDFLRYYEARPANFPMTILNYALSYHNALITDHRQAYFAAHLHANALTDYAAVLFDVAEHWQEPGYQLKSKQEQILADRLAVPEQYSVVEANALKLIAGVASHDLLVLLNQRLKRLDERWPLRDMRVLILWLGALMSRDLEFADELQAKLQPIFERSDNSVLITQYYSNWQFGVAASKWLHQPTAAHAAVIKTMIADLLVMNNRDDAYWYQNMFTRMQHSSGPHHVQLIDHPQTLQTSHTVGELMQTRRQVMGVGVEALATAVRASTLRRFEAGQTQLAFSVLVDLMGELGLMPSQVLRNLDQTRRHPNGVMSLRPTYLKVAKLSQPEAQTAIAQFAVENSSKPDQILSVQLFVLHSVINDDADQTRAEAQQIFTQLLNMNTWYLLELFAVNAVVKWLSVEQLLLLFEHGRRLFEEHPPLLGVISYLFDAVSLALVQVVKTAPTTVAQPFVQQLQWVTQKGKETPGSWLATGAWLVANAVLDPTAVNQDAVQAYLQRSKRVGHVEAIRDLKQAWQGVATPTLLTIQA